MATSSAVSSVPNSAAIELNDIGGHGAFALPSVYITRPMAITGAENIVKEEIPTIDLSFLKSGNLDERSKIIRDIGRACEDWGCFMLVNHGVSEMLQTSLMEAFAAFFDLPMEEREEYLVKQVLDPIRHEMGLTRTEDGENYWRDFVRIFVHPIFHSPIQPLHFRKISEEFSRQTRDIAKEILGAIWESLGLEKTDMETALDLKSGQQILVGNRYPQYSQAEETLGLPSHSDTALITILMQKGTVSGLQVTHRGKWVPTEPIPGSFVIHTGDLLEIVSNGRYKSVLHRVVLNNNSTRMSVITAFGPPLENVIVAPAPKLVESAMSSAAYRGITYREFIELNHSYPSEKTSLDLLRL